MMMMRMMMIRAEGNINHSRDCNQWLSGDGQHMLLYSDFSVNNHHFEMIMIVMVSVILLMMVRAAIKKKLDVMSQI